MTFSINHLTIKYHIHFSITLFHCKFVVLNQNKGIYRYPEFIRVENRIMQIPVFSSLQLVVSRYSDSPSLCRILIRVMQYDGYHLSLLYQKALELESSQSPYFPEGDSTIEKKA